MTATIFDRLVASPCCNPALSLEDVLSAYSKMGFVKYEVFTSWVQSAFDIDRDPRYYSDALGAHGMRVASLHLPVVEKGDAESLERSVRGARFAAALGAPVVLYKADSRQTYIDTARRFLDAIADLPLTAVLQNQVNTPISSLADFREVLDGIDDARMHTLLEVGHFHSAGVSWQEGCSLLGDSISLVHIKDKVGMESVVFGTGEIDYPALFRHMRDVNYGGDYVMEIEAGGREHTLDLMEQSLEYLTRECKEYLTWQTAPESA